MLSCVGRFVNTTPSCEDLMRSWNRKPRLSTWASELVPLPSPSRPLTTLSKQTSLRRLPIPELKDTVDRYLRTLEPIYTVLASRDLRGAIGSSDLITNLVDVSRARQSALATDFLRPGGLGDALQARLRGMIHISIVPYHWLLLVLKL